MRRLTAARCAVLVMVLAACTTYKATRPSALHADHQTGTYRGTHSGGAIEFDVSGSGITRVAVTNPPGLECEKRTYTYTYRAVGGLPITNHAFQDPDTRGTA